MPHRKAFGVLSLMTAVLAFGTVGFHLVTGWTWFDSFYMALITLTTVGFEEVHPLSTSGRVFASVLMLVGVTSVFVAIGLLGEIVLETEFREFFGRKRRKRFMEKLSDHYIICGAGRVGRAVVEELLLTGAKIVLVDSRPERAAWADEVGVPVLVEDATHDETLRKAGIERARGLVAAIGSDAQNVYVTLAARGLNPNLVIAARAAEEEAVDKMRRAGATVVLTPYSLIGRRLAQSMTRPEVVSFLDDASSLGTAKLDLDIEQMKVSERSPLASKALEESSLLRSHRVMILAIRKEDGRLEFNPTGGTHVEKGDMLIAMGERSQLKKIEAELVG